MTDYNPEPRPEPRPESRAPRDEYADKYGITDRADLNAEPVESRAPYAFIAILAGVALVGGFLFFDNQQPKPQQADMPRINMSAPLEQPAPAPSPAQTPAQNQAPTRLPAAPPEGPITTPPDSVTPANPQR